MEMESSDNGNNGWYKQLCGSPGGSTAKLLTMFCTNGAVKSQGQGLPQ